MRGIIAWLRARREQSRQRDRIVAMLVVLTESTPGVPPPSKEIQRWVNHALNEPIYHE